MQEDHSNMNYAAEMQYSFVPELMTVESANLCPPLNCAWGRRVYVLSRSTSISNAFKATLFELNGNGAGDYRFKH